MTAAATGAEPHAWARFEAAWHLVFFALLLLLAAALVAFDSESSAGRRVAVLALLGAIGLWYAVVGVRGLQGRGRVGLLYVVVLLSPGGCPTRRLAARCTSARQP